MKDQILKIAGVKSEKEFYKKFPTEEAFMAKHGKALKKAAMGAKMVDTQLTQLTDFSNPPQAQAGFNFDDALVGAQATNLGMSKDQYMEQQKMMADQANAQTIAGKGSDTAGQALGGLQDIVSLFSEGDTDMTKVGDVTEIGDAIGRNGLTIEEAQFGKFIKGIGSKLGGLAKTAGKNLMDKKQDNWMYGDRGLFGSTKKAGDSKSAFNPMDLFGANKKSTATFNTKTGMVDNASGSVSKADTDALGLGEGIPAGKGFDWGGAAGSALAAAPDIINGIGQIKEQKAAIKKADQSAQISGLTARAAESSPVGIEKHKFVRPEDQKFGPNQMSPSFGTGSNVLNAQYGAEIQNTYAPNNLYMDLGYEPLHDSNPKQYAYGGQFPTAEFGDYFQDSGQASIGKGVGSAIGSAFFGPVGGQVGGFLGKVAGNLLGGAQDANDLANFQDQTEKNVERSAWAQGAKSIQSQYSSSMKDGGWVSHDWQPQVIASFGEHKLSNLLRPPYDADMLRAGGHLKEYTPPSERAMSTERPNMAYGGQMAYGGDLQTLWGGKLNTVSHNEYLGDSVEAEGNSHDKSNGRGQTGIGVQYGDNIVEVENEPIQKFNNGGSSDDVVVYGDINIPNYVAKNAGDEKLEGVKFKKAVFGLNDKEAKLNKIQQKASDLALVSDDGSIDGQLGMNSALAMDFGADLGKRMIADKKKKLAAGQNAILDAAKEYGYDDPKQFSKDVLKGELKSKKGKMNLDEQTAQNGMSFMQFPLNNAQRQSFQGPGGTLYEGAKHYVTERGQLPLFARMLGAKPKPSYFNQELNNTLMNADDRSYLVGSQYNPGLSNDLMYGTRNFTPYNADMMSSLTFGTPMPKAAVAQKSANTGVPVNVPVPPTAAADASSGIAPTNAPVSTGAPSVGAAVASAASAPGAAPSALTPVDAQGVPTTVDPDKYAMIKDLYAKAEKTKKGADVLKFQKEYHKLFPEFARAVIGKDPRTAYAKKMGYDIKDLRGNEDKIFGKRTKQYMAALDNAAKTPPTPPVLPPRKVVPPTEIPTEIEKPVDEVTPPKQKFPWEPIINEGLNYLRPFTKNPFDYRQTLGEQYALANNQLDPVQAQLYNPMLDTPYDVSFQDQLNANQSDFNAMLRQAGNNPEAMSALAAQKYGANSSVLANQFRVNQANKAAVYSKNRDIMNDAQLKNLQILDTQYARQAQAKSNTKAQAVAALNSISAKMLQNELATKQLNTYENLYNYRFGRNMRAINLNGIAPITMPTVYTPGQEQSSQTVPDTGVALPTWEDYTKFVEQAKAAKGKAKTTTTKTTKARNGAIVKALKNL